MKKLLLFIVLTSAAFGQGSFSGQLVLSDSQGHPLGGATITTFSDSACTVPVNSWTNQALTLPSVGGQAFFNTDGLGNFSFWAPPSSVYYKASGVNITSTSCFLVTLPVVIGSSPQFVSVTTSKVTGFYYVDGTTYPTVQSAITAACTATPQGGTVYIPPGTFAAPNLAGLTLCSYLNIIGSGRGLADSSTCPTTITTNQITGDFFAITNMVHIHLSDLCIKNVAAAGANAAIRLNYGQFNVLERLYISGPFAVAIELDTSSTSTGSTIRNTFRDIFDTGLAANGIGCLLNSNDASSKVINNNIFDMVACQGGASGASAVGVKLTNSGVHNQVINENTFRCDEVATFNGGGGGTGIQVDQGSTADTVFIGCNVENNVTGLNKATANTITFMGGNISANGTNVTDAQPGFTSFIATKVGGIVQTFAVTPLGQIYVDGIGLHGAAPLASAVNGPGTGLALAVSGTSVVTVNSNGVTFSQPILGPGFQRQVFTGSGTFTIPAGITQVKVTVLGGGGGGAGAANTSQGQSGSTGGIAIKWLTGLTPGNTLTITIGGGGGGGASGANPGSNGVDSTVASGTQVISTITGGHGTGGATGNAAAAAGGSATGGDINIAGSPGTVFEAGNNGTNGPSTFFGPGGLGSAVAGGNANNNSGAGGGGGGGGGGATAGGNGGSGIIVIEWVS